MIDLTSIPLTTLAGEPTTLAPYRGKVLLIVNVASQCGFAPQYAALEATYRFYKDDGLVVLGFPSNDFGGQEPGDSLQIANFCSANFFITFPMFEKIPIAGADAHPLYRELIAAQPKPIEKGPEFRKMITDYATEHALPAPNPLPGVFWNFEKFLVGRNGTVLARFGTEISPDDPQIVKAIEAALRKS